MNHFTLLFFITLALYFYQLESKYILVPNSNLDARSQLNWFYFGGEAHKILNTLCGRHLLLKPETPISQDIHCNSTEWQRYIHPNPIKCQCGKFGPVKEKNTYFALLLMAFIPNKISITPSKVVHALSNNVTTHLLLDARNTIVYYEVLDNGVLKSGFTDNFVSVSSQFSSNSKILACENFLSYVLKIMAADVISFSVINGNDDTFFKFFNYLTHGAAAFHHDNHASPTLTSPFRFV